MCSHRAGYAPRLVPAAKADSARRCTSCAQPPASSSVHAGDSAPSCHVSCCRTTSEVASDASPRRASTRAASVSAAAVSQRPWKGTPRSRGESLDRRSLLGRGIDRVGDDRMPRREREARLAQHDGVDLGAGLGRVRLRREADGLLHPEQALALEVAAQMHRARRRPELRRQRRRQRGLAGARQAADGDQPGRGRLQIVQCRPQIGARRLPVCLRRRRPAPVPPGRPSPWRGCRPGTPGTGAAPAGRAG